MRKIAAGDQQIANALKVGNRAESIKPCGDLSDAAGIDATDHLAVRYIPVASVFDSVAINLPYPASLRLGKSSVSISSSGEKSITLRDLALDVSQLQQDNSSNSPPSTPGPHDDVDAGDDLTATLDENEEDATYSLGSVKLLAVRLGGPPDDDDDGDNNNDASPAKPSPTEIAISELSLLDHSITLEAPSSR